MLELKIQRGQVWLFTRRNVNWSWFWSNCILPKNVGQQQIIKHVTIFLNQSFFQRHKLVQIFRKCWLWVLLAPRVTPRDRQKGNWSGKDLGSLLILPSSPFHPHSGTLLFWCRTHCRNGTLFPRGSFPPGNEVCCYANAGGPSSGDPDFLLTKADLFGRHQDWIIFATFDNNP